MFSFFNTRPTLKDLIPEGYVDIHSHLLPGIDDGAKTIDDTRFLISGLQNIGFSQFITTPHVMQNVWENTTVGIEGSLISTTDLLDADPPVKLKAAAEYLMDMNFMELLRTEPLRTIKDNYILVEMSYINPPIQLYQMLFDIQLAGYIPVLAHPERYTFYNVAFDEYKKLKNAGCLFQMNLLSAVGNYGEWPMQTANKLLQEGMLDFTGSDVHHQNHLRSFDKPVLFKNSKDLEALITNNEFFKF